MPSVTGSLAPSRVSVESVVTPRDDTIDSGTTISVTIKDGTLYSGTLCDRNDCVIKLPLSAKSIFTLFGVTKINGAGFEEQIGIMSFPGWAVSTLKYKDGHDVFDAKIDNKDIESAAIGVSGLQRGKEDLGRVPYGSHIEIWLDKRWYSGILHCELDENTGLNDVIVLRKVQTWAYNKKEEHASRLMVHARELMGMAVVELGQECSLFCNVHKCPAPLDHDLPVGRLVEILAHDQLYTGTIWENEVTGPIEEDTVIALRNVKLWGDDGEKMYASRLFFLGRDVKCIIPVKAFNIENFPNTTAIQRHPFPEPARHLVVLRVIREDGPLGLPMELQWDMSASNDMLLALSNYDIFGGYLSSQNNERRVPSDRIHELLQLIEGDSFELVTSNVVNERVEYVFSEKIDSEDDEEVAREQSEIEAQRKQFEEEMQRRMQEAAVRAAAAKKEKRRGSATGVMPTRENSGRPSLSAASGSRRGTMED